MFTGLVEEAGQVVWLRQSSEAGLQLQVRAPGLARAGSGRNGIHRGDSIAVNGCCLTVSAHRGEFLTFDVLQETLARTNLGRLRPESLVNLERSLAADGRLGGHFVQGHVDCASVIRAFAKEGDDYRLEVALPPDFAHYVAFKGSVAVNGISLTVAEKHPDAFVCWIIPHTRRATNLATAQAGDLANLEFDILAKYVEARLGSGFPLER